MITLSRLFGALSVTSAALLAAAVTDAINLSVTFKLILVGSTAFFGHLTQSPVAPAGRKEITGFPEDE